MIGLTPLASSSCDRTTFRKGMSRDIASWDLITLINDYEGLHCLLYLLPKVGNLLTNPLDLGMVVTWLNPPWFSHLLDRKLSIAAITILFYSIEHKVAPGVDVQLPGLLLQVLHGELQVRNPWWELSLIVVALLLRLRQTDPELVQIPHDVSQGLVDSFLQDGKNLLNEKKIQVAYLLLN